MKHVAQGELIQHLAGELPDPSKRDVEAHLEVCRDCCTSYADLVAVRNVLGEWSVETASRDLWARVERALEAPEQVTLHPRWRRVARVSRIAAAVALGMGLGHVAGRLARTVFPADRVVVADATEEEALAELGFHALESPSSAGLFRTVLELTDATQSTEVTP